MDTLLDRIRHHHFVYYKITGNFCTTSNFSSADFNSETVKLEKDGISVVQYSTAGSLFQLSNVVLPPHVKDFILTKQKWLNPGRKDETKIMAKNVLIHIFDSITFEPKYAGDITGIQKLSAEAIGIGSLSTLHGTPDMLIYGLPLVYMPDVEEENSAEYEENDLSGFGSNGKDTSVSPQKQWAEISVHILALYVSVHILAICAHSCIYIANILLSPVQLSSSVVLEIAEYLQQKSKIYSIPYLKDCILFSVVALTTISEHLRAPFCNLQ